MVPFAIRTSLIIFRLCFLSNTAITSFSFQHPQIQRIPVRIPNSIENYRTRKLHFSSISNHSPKENVKIFKLDTLEQLILKEKYLSKDKLIGHEVELKESILSCRSNDHEYTSCMNLVENFIANLIVQQKYSEAETFLAQMLQESLESSGTNQKKISFSYSNLLANFHFVIKKYSQAENYFRRTLELAKMVFLEDNQITISTTLQLGNTLSLQNKLPEAETLYLDIISKLKALGAEHELFLLALNRLTSVYMQQNKRQEAIQLREKNYEYMKDTLGRHDKFTVKLLINSVDIYGALQNYEKVESLIEELLPIATPLLGPYDLDKISLYLCKAKLLSTKHKHDEATNYFLKCYDLYKDIYGDHGKPTLQILPELAHNYHAAGKEKDFEETVETWYKHLKEVEDPSIVRTIRNADEMRSFAKIYAIEDDILTNKVKFQATLELLSHAVDIYREKGKLFDLDVLLDLTILGKFYALNSNYIEAEKIFLDILTIQNSRNIRDTVTIDAMQELATAYLSYGPSHFPEAEAMLTSCLELMKEVLDENDPQIKMVTDLLKNVKNYNRQNPPKGNH